MKTIDAKAFEAISARPGVVLVDFTAKWCPPCRAMDPVIDAIEREYAGRVRVVAVDVEDELLLAQRFDVRSMPTLVLVRDGREVGRTIGARPRAFIVGMIERAFAGDRAIASP